MAKTISQFHNMQPDVPEWTDANHMYSLTNVDPLYYLAEGGQEKQTFPLVASRAFTTLTTGVAATITSMIPTETNLYFDVFTTYDNGSVYGFSAVKDGTGAITSTSVSVMGFAFGGGGGITGINNKITVFANKLVGIRYKITDPNGSGSMSYTNVLAQIGSASSWTSYAWNAVTNPYEYNANPETAVFQDKLWVSDKYNQNTMSAVRGYTNTGATLVQDTSLVLNIPTNYSILRMANYRNKYLAVAGAYSSVSSATAPGGMVQNSRNYIFMFNGISKTYQYTVPLPGSFVDMIMVEDDLKVLLQNKFGQYSVYTLNGTKLSLDHVLQIDTPQQLPLFSYLGLLGINLTTKGVYIMGKTKQGEVKYIYTNQNFSNLIAGTLQSSLYSYNGSNLYSQQVIGSSYNDVTAVSQWVGLNTKLSSVDVTYDTPPQAVGDYIRVTLDGFSEDQADGVTTVVLNDITSTNKQTRIKTTLDTKGLTPSMARLTVQTHSTGAWRPIIRELQLNESKV